MNANVVLNSHFAQLIVVQSINLVLQRTLLLLGQRLAKAYGDWASDVYCLEQRYISATLRGNHVLRHESIAKKPHHLKEIANTSHV